MIRAYRLAPGFYCFGISRTPHGWHLELVKVVITTEPGP